MDVHHQLDRLKILKSLTHDESALIYLALSSEIRSYDQLNLVHKPVSRKVLIQLLSALPIGHCGLTPLTLGLFHPYRKVRFAAADLLERIDAHPVSPHLSNILIVRLANTLLPH
jgi:hypothetical protein